MPLIPPLLDPPLVNRPILNRPVLAPLPSQVGLPNFDYNSYAGPQLGPAPVDAYGYGGPTPGCSDCGDRGPVPSPLPGPSYPPHDYPPPDYGYPNDYGQAPPHDYPHDPLAYPAGYGSNYPPTNEPPMDGNRRVIASTPSQGSYPPPSYGSGSYPPPSIYPSGPGSGTFQGAPLPMLPMPQEMPKDKEPMN